MNVSVGRTLKKALKPTAQDVSKIYVLRFPDEPDKISGHRWQHLNVV
jgi:hypothetical protein